MQIFRKLLNFYLIAWSPRFEIRDSMTPDLLKMLRTSRSSLYPDILTPALFKSHFRKFANFSLRGLSWKTIRLLSEVATGCLTLLAGERGVGGESTRNYPLSSTDVLYFHTPRIYSHFEIFNASSVAKSLANRLRFMGLKRKSVCVSVNR